MFKFKEQSIITLTIKEQVLFMFTFIAHSKSSYQILADR